MFRSKPMIYLCHPMRGKKGDTGESNIDYDYQNVNSDIAIENVRWLRVQYPQVNWYCPGEVEPPVQTAHRLGFLTVDQIFEIDFSIIKDMCSGALAHEWEDSVGVKKEVDRCIDFGYPFYIFTESKYIWECNQEAILALVNRVLEFHSRKNKNLECGLEVQAEE